MAATVEAKGNGPSAFHWKAVDLIVRILTPIMAVVLAAMLGVMIDNQHRLLDMEARLQVLEERTRVTPSQDYRDHIDDKFATLSAQLAEIQRDLKAHMGAAR